MFTVDNMQVSKLFGKELRGGMGDNQGQKSSNISLQNGGFENRIDQS